MIGNDLAKCLFESGSFRGEWDERGFVLMMGLVIYSSIGWVFKNI